MATKKDLGVDLALFDDKFKLTVDYFDESQRNFHATPVFARHDWPARKESFANVGKVNLRDSMAISLSNRGSIR